MSTSLLRTALAALCLTALAVTTATADIIYQTAPPGTLGNENDLIAAIDSSSPLAASVLNFNLPALAPNGQDGYGPGRAYLESGFRLTTTNDPGFNGAIIRFNPSGNAFLPNDGTIHFGATYFSNPLLDRPDNGLFSISQIDLADYSQGVVVPNIAFRGNKADGSLVNTTFTLSTQFDPNFHSFQFRSAWTNLRSVSFLTQGFAWDNIVVTPSGGSVPEPTGILTGLLCFGVAALRRRRGRVV